jgi:4-diphosphocytidyl-2-C-methyl-D-erythritol kinase
MKLKAPAKINLSLRILSKLSNGYHTIDSLMQTISLYDEIDIKPDKTGRITVICPGVPMEQNIAYRAATKLKQLLNEPMGAKIIIKKRIPSGAGLGGGSSDGACTIIGLLKIWNRKISTKKLHELTKTIGADVTFFLYGGLCRATGIGEKIKTINPAWKNRPYWILLVNPGIHVPTKLVYCLWDKQGKQNGQAGWINDLEQIVFKLHPRLAVIKQQLKSIPNVYHVSMSGSGSTMYAVFKNKLSATRAYAEYNIKPGYRKWLVKTTF